MCVVSNIGDQYSKPGYWPQWPQTIPFPNRDPFEFPVSIPENSISFLKGEITQLQIKNRDLQLQLEKTREQVERMKQELIEAKAQDIRDGNPDCEMEDKVIILKKIADLFGIKLTEVFPD